MALLLVQAGADTRLMDSEERTADMVSVSQSEEAICDSSDQSEEAICDSSDQSEETICDSDQSKEAISD